MQNRNSTFQKIIGFLAELPYNESKDITGIYRLGIPQETTLGILYVLWKFGIFAELQPTPPEIPQKARLYNKNARLLMRSFYELESTRRDTPLVLNEKERRNLLILMTRQLEISRENGARRPIHHRHIVNIVFKAKRPRKGKPADVYLHVYHPEWKAFHLVGESMEVNEQINDIELARRALRRFFGDDAPVDVKNLARIQGIDTIKLQELSKTNGAWTEYTYCLMEPISPIKELTLPKKSRFRWFTMDEIIAGKTSFGEKIMFSSTKIFDRHKDKISRLRVNVNKTDDPLPSPEYIDLKVLLHWLGMKINFVSAFSLAIIMISIILLIWFTNLAIAGVVIGILGLVFDWLQAKKK